MGTSHSLEESILHKYLWVVEYLFDELKTLDVISNTDTHSEELVDISFVLCHSLRRLEFVRENTRKFLVLSY